MLVGTFLHFNLNYQRNMITETTPLFCPAECYLQSALFSNDEGAKDKTMSTKSSESRSTSRTSQL